MPSLLTLPIGGSWRHLYSQFPRKLQPYRGTWSGFIHDPTPSTVGLFWNSDCFPEFRIIAHIVWVSAWVGIPSFPAAHQICSCGFIFHNFWRVGVWGGFPSFPAAHHRSPWCFIFSNFWTSQHGCLDRVVLVLESWLQNLPGPHNSKGSCME